MIFVILIIIVFFLYAKPLSFRGGGAFKEEVVRQRRLRAEQRRLETDETKLDSDGKN